ncbi:MAG: single-stranded-DNA-specific exonuclease RecJ [Lachnospiraceae bacterium]|nr:single-stranded-DNA-specific exonuclease RecJ [Lachnospiraceae bacterium]
MKTKWMVQNKRGDFKGIAAKFGIDQVTARLLRNRDVCTEEEIKQFLTCDVSGLEDGALMKDMAKGVAIIKRAILEHRKIRIIGDYDIDGVTASYILYRGIDYCKGEVSASIPDRIVDGYGINERLIDCAKEDGIDTIITCDNGISAMDAIKKAKDEGMHVVVTDHHNVPYITEEDGTMTYLQSEADAIINPKQIECAYPFKEICGAVVAYKFVEQLLRAFLVEEEKIKTLLSHLLMYAAIGTVGDIMELKGENRIIVKRGLELIRECDDPSLCALIRACNLDQSAISAYHIGYILGPCINASGRIDTAENALKLLLCKDRAQCDQLAAILVSLNEERKKMTEESTKEAIKQVEETSLKEDLVLVVYLEDCHESIAGIIAGRIRERFGKPTFVITKSESELKGSARSIETYNIYDEMMKVSDVFTRFGGHPMAAGCSLPENKLAELRRRLNENCTLTKEDLVEKVSIDVPMPMDYVTMPLIEEMDLLRPYGKGNPSPLFAQKNVEVVHVRIIGKERKFVKLKLKSEAGNYFDGIYFEDPGVWQEFLLEKFGEETTTKIMSGEQTGVKISICYVPDINEFRGYRNIQMQIKYVS